MTKPRKRRRIVPKKASVWQQWRHFAAYVYLGICIFDFFIMPIVYELTHRAMGPVELIQASRGLDAAAQVEIIKVFSEGDRWQPLTLGETGLFHVAFGAILGVAAWTRGVEKNNRIQRGMHEAYEYQDDEYMPQTDVAGDDLKVNHIEDVHIHVGAEDEQFDMEAEPELPPPGGRM